MVKMLKVKDIQEHLGISQRKAYALIQTKGFPKIMIGHRYFIPENKYSQWIDENVKHKIIL
jgi:predicted DNA-binding transcriptional regulator AlpA